MLRLGGSYKKNLDLHLAESARSHHIDYSIHASILRESQIDEMEFCAKKGITSFKLYMNLGDEVGHVYMDMNPGQNLLVEEKVEINSKIVEQVIHNASRLGCTVLVHAEDYQMCSCGIREAKDKNKNGLGAWSESRPGESEVKSITTASGMARKQDATLFCTHWLTGRNGCNIQGKEKWHCNFCGNMPALSHTITRISKGVSCKSNAAY
ncbi:hypothetical protein [Candidatus Nitrosotalea sp. TS]|uniref:hypothetical protein n=1 Tax=Candidatus Nitrosotalea sp. TS TaxID=2341020 RepID=UPI002A4E240D|nr:hypothetical protein [Candidatus Nitrosotalea sp. TS]